MKFTAKISRDIRHSESAIVHVEAADEADAERIALEIAEADEGVDWQDDNIAEDDPQDVEVLWVDALDDGEPDSLSATRSSG
jgi:hypothetical protein